MIWVQGSIFRETAGDINKYMAEASKYIIGLKTIDGQRVIDTAKKTGYPGFLVNAISLKVLESTLLTEETGMR